MFVIICFLCEVSHSLAQRRHPSILLYPACRHFWSKSVLSFFPFFFLRRLFVVRLKLSIFYYPVPLFGTNFYDSHPVFFRRPVRFFESEQLFDQRLVVKVYLLS